MAHLFPARKHLSAFWTAPSLAEGWRGFGAVVAVVIFQACVLAPKRRRRHLVRRHPRIGFALGGALFGVHLVPACEHAPRLAAALTWEDGWRVVGACLALLLFGGWVRSAFRSFTNTDRRTALALAALSATAYASGCGGSTNREGFGDDGGLADVSDGGPADDGSAGAFGAGSASPSSDAPEQSGKTLLYAHTDNALYSFDPADLAKPPTPLGDFDCVGGTNAAPSMTDIAVTKDGKLYGVSEIAAYPLTVASGKVHCDATWTLPSNTKFYGLTVAPENTVKSSEVLIAANSSGQLFEIDAVSGAPTEVGTLGKDPQSGKPWSLSGDIVFLANGGQPVGFATVRTCSGTGGTNCSTVDTLIEVNVSAIKPGAQSVLKAVRGQVTKGSWCTNAASPSTFGSMFGIAALHDKVYGFSRKGDVVEIHNDDGSGCLVAAYASDRFAGAGVTTVAPVDAPPPN